MKLLVDIGNTRIKWAWWDGRRLVGNQSIPHGGRLPEDFVLALKREAPPEAVLVSSVVGPELNDALRAAVSDGGAMACRFLTSPAEALGVTNAYAEPSTLGPDRWAALIGAWVQGRAPVCVVSCGTAVTVDVLDGQGTHRGGVIFAGLGLSRAALASGTHRLSVSGDGDLPVLASDTTTGIRTGTLQALTGAVNYVVSQVSRELSALPTVLLTGGDAPLVAEKLSGHNPLLEPDLVLRGLAAMAEDM